MIVISFYPVIFLFNEAIYSEERLLIIFFSININLFFDTEEYKLYESLVRGEKGEKSIGRGEAGGIALAKTYNGILASNNYKDIAPYIEKYNLKHIDTGQIPVEALEKGLITEDEGNSIWTQMLAKRRKLPASTFSEYLER